jgi:hypothetical protein
VDQLKQSPFALSVFQQIMTSTSLCRTIGPIVIPLSTIFSSFTTRVSSLYRYQNMDRLHIKETRTFYTLIIYSLIHLSVYRRRFCNTTILEISLSSMIEKDPSLEQICSEKDLISFISSIFSALSRSVDIPICM